MFTPAQVTQVDCQPRPEVVAFVAIAFYFIIFELQTGMLRFHNLLMLQRLKRLRRKRMVFVRVHDREISSGLKGFYKEIS